MQKGFALIFILIGVLITISLIGGVYYLGNVFNNAGGTTSQPKSPSISKPSPLPTEISRLMPPSNLIPRPTSAKPARVTIPPGYSHESLNLKFRESATIRLRDDRFVTLGNDDLSGLEAVLGKYQGVRIQRLFDRPEEDLAQEKARIEAQSKRQQADLNLYYRLILPSGMDAEAVLNDLNALSIVETIYAEPLPQPPP